MKVYMVNYPNHAGHWIYKGFDAAWRKLGYDVVLPTERGTEHAFTMPMPASSKYPGEDYIIMTVDALVNEQSLEAISKSHKTFVFAQPNTFPLPWGAHPNFQCGCPDNIIESLNKMDNVYLWTFGEVNPEFHNKWKKVHTVPLAFDSISYVPIKEEKYTKYDICYIGGWANNGFNEKRKIMIESFSAFQESGLKCAFFINKNLSHEQESALLYNSRISLNLHDAYQRALGMDTNERTFKSLGLNGILISDEIGQLKDIFPNVKTSNNPLELVKMTKEYLSLTEKERYNIKEENRQNILDNHCYTNRVEQLLSL